MADGMSDADVGKKLYRRFKAGDEAAFTELIALYRGSLESYVHGFVGDRREAEELALDAFAELAVSDSFKGDSSLKTYLFAIARHIALRHARRFKGAACIPIDAILDETEGGAAESENPTEAAYLRQERAERLNAAIAGLKPDYREALHLVYFEGMGHAEAARAMGKTGKHIENLVRRARASLKKRLDDEVEMP